MNCPAEHETKKVVIMGFGSVGQHIAQLLLTTGDATYSRPSLCIVAISGNMVSVSWPDLYAVQ